MDMVEKKTLPEILYMYVLNQPDQLCVVDSIGTYTYSEFWKKIISATTKLKNLSIKVGDCILVECTQDANYLACDFACNFIGAIFVPVEHKASVDRINQICEETKAVLFIHEEEVNVTCDKMSFSKLFDAPENSIVEVVFPKGNEVAEILYTTGTTGKSKGIVVTHFNNVALAENIAYGTEMKERNVELIPLPISHSHGLRCCYANFYKGGCVVLTEGVSQIKKIYDLIVKYKVTAIDVSPTAMTYLIKLSKGKFSEFDEQFDYIQIGTAMLQEDVKNILKNQFPNVRLYNFYGSTESGRSCVLNFNSADDRKYCIGKPTKNAKFIITDLDRNPIVSSAEHTGILACAGSMNMKGYLNQPELTESICENGYIFTSDEGYIDENGFVYVIGRIDDVINYKGIKISPSEIEEVASNYSDVEDCACVPLSDSAAGQVPKLFIKVNKKTFERSKFVEYLRAHIDQNKMPREITVIDTIPRTYNGKIKRKDLIEK